jgi:hypothetical protein
VIVILVMFIVGMARMLVDILVRAIILARVRGWGFWMFGALWDTAFQVAVSPFRWAVEKGKEECRKMAQEARQTALKHTHKLPRRLWDGEKERAHPPVRGRPQGSEECGPSCRERRTLWKEELSSLSTLVSTMATLLAVITPSEGAESGREPGWHPRWSGEPGMEGILIMDYWMVLPVIVMVVTGLIMRIQRHLGEVWKPGDDGPILARVGEANLPIGGGGTAPNN